MQISGCPGLGRMEVDVKGTRFPHVMVVKLPKSADTLKNVKVYTLNGQFVWNVTIVQ